MHGFPFVTAHVFIDPFMPEVPKSAWLFWWYLINKPTFQKLLGEDNHIKGLQTTFLQMFLKFISTGEDILISLISPDETCQGEF